MIELVILACLAAAPSDCRETRLSYSSAEVSLLTCMQSGHFEVARWQTEHPGLQVKRWKCNTARQFGYSI